jgi:hypothetical protein
VSEKGWSPKGYQSIAATHDGERVGRVCECARCKAEGQHEPMCSIHMNDGLPPQICDCPKGPVLPPEGTKA